ncbi:PREDICTED: uncharacterized protein LOC108779949 [Cyphomyrmex costatus]|uniref:uncharacterized protein LOC108779949 n=1 Tax=Cyphomyrmex costatus TaxID=456900 RepID=UPI00085228D6|nr:PREDICTED: uncharacterized protein LOC108779949 [Cyphomyrmex costatus]
MRPPSAIKVVFWNCRGVLRKKDDIEKLAETIDILFLAETCVSSLRDFRVRGFDCLRIDANLAEIRGMLVLIYNLILYSQVDLSNAFDDSFEALELSINNSRLLLIDVYRHPNAPVPANSLSALSPVLDKYEFFILLTISDFNAHHPMWGGTRTNAAGRVLASCIDNNHLVILNPPSSPTHISFSRPSSSIIDLAIASPRISSLCDTLISSDLLGSDHYPIEVQVNCGIRISSVFSYKIELSKEQRMEVLRFLHHNANSISQKIKDTNPDDPVSQYNDIFMELISESYERFSPSIINLIPRIKHHVWLLLKKALHHPRGELLTAPGPLNNAVMLSKRLDIAPRGITMFIIVQWYRIPVKSLEEPSVLAGKGFVPLLI